jgi:hypothetical protein
MSEDVRPIVIKRIKKVAAAVTTGAPGRSPTPIS